MSGEGVLFKALSGFYYVADGTSVITCRAPGRFRHTGSVPLVGDRVRYALSGADTGVLTELLPRRNEFARPAVANIDQLVMVVSSAAPRTEPFLIDRMAAVAELRSCEPVVCVNKFDLDPDDSLYALYRRAGIASVQVSARTGEGMDALRALLAGKVSALTGNSGVGKSSLLNALMPDASLAVGEVSEKLGRGRHTTRHIELYRLPDGAFAADTPGFSSFDADRGAAIRREELQYAFREFRPYLGGCRFTGCAHMREPGCAVLKAVEEGHVAASRHASYARMYETALERKEWENPST